jgi:hypothetical protein
MQFIRLIGILGVAIAPLFFLTASTFFRGPGTAVGGWTPPVLEEFDKVRSGVERERARLADGGTTAAVDPAGFSLEGEPEGDLALPYELAERLAAAEKARHVDDLEAAEAARNGLDRMVADRLVAIQKIRPNGVELAADVKRRLELAKRRCIWLTNRQLAGRDLKVAEEAMAAGPEGDGETKCLLTIKGLRKQLPATAESIGDEPGDALAPDEAARATALEARATFRHDFFKARQSSRAEAASSRDLERLLEEWAGFLATYGKNGPPDDRDKPLLDEAKTLQRKSQLDLLRAAAREQSNAIDLAERVAAWLNEAGRNPAEFDQERKAARSLVQSWLESKLSPLPPLPKPVPGVEEGDTGKKRLIGFFEKVNGTPAQYRWWPWNMAEKKRRELNKGEKQPNLKAAPTPPRHGAFAADYAESRKEFLARGFTTGAGVERFRSDCDRLASDFDAYRQQWDDVDFPADKAAENWGEAFAAGRKVAEELLTACEKHRLWEFLRE